VSAPPPDFEIRLADEGGVSVVTVSGELDLATVARFEETIRDQLAAQPVRLDLAGLTFMDSSGVRALDGLLRELAPKAWRLSIVPDLQDSVRQILEITGMIDVLPFEHTEPGERP
jgi:anti-anti-sigma factor